MLIVLSRVATNLVRRLCERGKSGGLILLPPSMGPAGILVFRMFAAVIRLSLACHGGSCCHKADPDFAGYLHPCI